MMGRLMFRATLYWAVLFIVACGADHLRRLPTGTAESEPEPWTTPDSCPAPEPCPVETVLADQDELEHLRQRVRESDSALGACVMQLVARALPAPSFNVSNPEN